VNPHIPEQSALKPQRKQRMQPLIFASCRVSPQFSQKSTGVLARVDAAVGAGGTSDGGVGGCRTKGAGLCTDLSCTVAPANQEQCLIVGLGAMRARSGSTRTSASRDVAFSVRSRRNRLMRAR
jgi:hypothetical protein